ncbi:unnamed protein product [Cuscuta europaea]|nr:unnamed protein product [Cuscuta europaea]
MLTHIQDLFVLPTNSEKHILQTMGAAHKNFRCTLYTEFIAQHMDEPEKLSLPPKEYKHIGTDEWRIFVKRCFTEEFQVIELTNAFNISRNICEYM